MVKKLSVKRINNIKKKIEEENCNFSVRTLFPKPHIAKKSQRKRMTNLTAEKINIFFNRTINYEISGIVKSLCYDWQKYLLMA